LELLLDPQVWMAFLTLTALEIVLGIDNIIVIAILVSRLPEAQRQMGRLLGLGFAMLTRIGLLFSLVWLMGLTSTLFTVMGEEISGRDLILIFGGLFLIYKSTSEVHSALENGAEDEGGIPGGMKKVALWTVVLQIAIIDIVFSLDSVITAVGLVQQLPVMVAAIVVAVLVMMWAAKPISDFVDEHPTIKMLALSFLVLIGVFLIAEGLDMHIPKGYIYFAMAFSVVVEMLNIRLRKRRAAPVKLHGPQAPTEENA
jgi:predicted tellurium resistance membrane protein TerC